MSDTPCLFRSVNEALTFAYRYQAQQLPRTPMQRLYKRPGEEQGADKGLHGVDGAGQAGMILNAIDRLPGEMRQVLVVRYGDVREECACCHQPAPTQRWLDAVEELSRCKELEGLPKRVRRAAIERALHSRKWDAARLSAIFGLSERTLRHQAKCLRERFAKVERQALQLLDEDFRRQPGMLPE